MSERCGHVPGRGPTSRCRQVVGSARATAPATVAWKEIAAGGRSRPARSSGSGPTSTRPAARAPGPRTAPRGTPARASVATAGRDRRLLPVDGHPHRWRRTPPPRPRACCGSTGPAAGMRRWCWSARRTRRPSWTATRLWVRTAIAGSVGLEVAGTGTAGASISPPATPAAGGRAMRTPSAQRTAPTGSARCPG